jgi:2-succinyl-6-hydroxy-2,4-cyclohexadiene-1-carboxylate synthase
LSFILESIFPASDLYFEIHPGNGPYLLLVHGILSSRAQWMLNLEALSRVTRPVVVELLGHGRSPAPETEDPYRPEGYVRAFEQIREGLGVPQWLLCGQSLGAALTLKYALDHPERILAQVITNSTSAFREIKNREEAVRGASFIGQKVIEGGVEGIRKIPVHPINARSLPQEVKVSLVKDSASLSVPGVANAIRYTAADLSLRDEIYRNRVPTLLVCGQREKRFKPLRDYAEAHMPLLEIIDLDGGHAVNIDAAEAFNQAVSIFFLRYSM